MSTDTPTEEMRYTQDKICDMLRNSQNAEVCGIHGDDLKAHMLSFIDGQHQFIYNMLHTPDFRRSHQSTLTNRPDFWQQGYNSMVVLYQTYVE